MTKNSVNLASIFGAVAEDLAQNQEVLDQADHYNNDHGANMVQTFQTIASALEKKQGSSDKRGIGLCSQASCQEHQ